MRVNESICTLAKRCTWRPTLQKVRAGSSVSVFLNGEWTERNIINIPRMSKPFTRNVDKIAEFDTVVIGEYQDNHIIDDICLDTTPISYKETWENEKT